MVEYAAAGGVIIRDGLMLLLDRPQRGEIRLPKGHIEAGETPQKTALREVTEETGFADLEIIADLGWQKVEFDYAGQHYRRTEHYFLMQLTGDRQTPRTTKDAADFRPMWAPLAKAVELLTFPAEQTVARKAIAACS